MAGVVIDINIQSSLYRDYADFATAWSTGNTRKAMKLAQKFILRWEYDKPLDVENAVLKLGIEQAAAVCRTLFETFEKLYETAPIGEVEVSFDAWDMDRFVAFDEARQARETAKYLPMLHEVAKAKGVKPDQELTLYNGMLLLKAVLEKSKKIFSGGN